MFGCGSSDTVWQVRYVCVGLGMVYLGRLGESRYVRVSYGRVGQVRRVVSR